MLTPTGPIWFAKPSQGEIVWCNFPEIPGTPSIKPRPALIMVVYDSPIQQYQVKVAYGTSQNTTDLRSGEFAITPKESAAYKASGLSVSSKFSFKKTILLPYNNVWFKEPNPPKFPNSPKLGVLDNSITHRYTAAYNATLPLK